MCGIAGYIGRNVHESDVAKMVDAVRHRGPNNRNVRRVDDMCVLGHARLSIMDLSENATQPMIDTAAKTAITVNGEIYNYLQIKERLEKDGYVFRSTSDSEVILHGYLRWGEDIVKMIDGMFSLAIYDGRAKKLILARDPAGIKPLYYYSHNGDFMFASEIKSFSAVQDNGIRFDPETMRTYLAYRYLPAPMTPYKNMYKLEPGHTLTLTAGKISISRNWDYNIKDISDENTEAEELRSFMNSNVKLHLNSDVPVGLLLSGGIDSSAVGAFMSKHMDTIDAFCCGFNEAAYDERKYARMSAESFGIKLHETVMDWETLRDGLEDYFQWFDEPFFNYSAVAINKLCRMAVEKNIRVLLCGEGADEIFAGYLWYDDFYDRFNENAADMLNIFFRYKGYFDEKMQNRLSGRQTDFDHLWLLKKYDSPGMHPVNRAQVLDFHTFLPDEVLSRDDISSMSEGLELRVPFLNKKMLDRFFLLNGDILYKNKERKYLLKKALNGIMPQNILTQRKKGFGFPLESWDRDITGICRRALTNGMMAEHGFICRSGLDDVLQNHNTHHKWLLLTAEMWMRKKLAGSDISELIYAKE